MLLQDQLRLTSAFQVQVNGIHALSALSSPASAGYCSQFRSTRHACRWNAHSYSDALDLDLALTLERLSQLFGVAAAVVLQDLTIKTQHKRMVVANVAGSTHSSSQGNGLTSTRQERP